MFKIIFFICKVYSQGKPFPHLIFFYSGFAAMPFISTQILLSLQASTIQLGRIAWLQLPFYSTWFWNNQWMQDSPASFWGIAFPIACAFMTLSFWLYRNISEKNMEKKWFRILFNSPEWKSVRKSMQFLREIENFKEDPLGVGR
jgi:hypothetical protein